MKTWLSISDFGRLVGKTLDEVGQMCRENKLVYKMENGEVYIEAASGTVAVIPKDDVSLLPLVSADTTNFVEKAIGTIIGMHEKVIEAKDETLEALKNENRFLKEGILSMQELYDEERNVVEVLSQQVVHLQEELDFAKRKYKLMWEKAVENHVR
jgi:hypothetical protein